MPYQPPPPFKNPRTFQPQVANFVGFPPRASANQARPVQARSMAVNPVPSGRQCYRCGGWGHLRRDCPSEEPAIPARSPFPAPRPLPPQEQVFQNCNNQRNQGGARGGGRNGGAERGGHGPQGKQGNPQAVVNQVTLDDEFEERAVIYAALDPSGRNQHSSQS